jgi:excisionase family DNA binding protein
MQSTSPHFVVPENLATLEEAAMFLNCHERTIRRHIAAGNLTGYRLGKRMIRVDLHEIRAAIKLAK